MSLARKGFDLSPYRQFSAEQWADLRQGEPMTLSPADVKRLRALNDPISFDEVKRLYLPLSRLLSLYVEAVQQLHQASATFLSQDHADRTPFVIGVSGSVAAGKSTIARILHALMQRWPHSPRVDLVTTDGFLFPNRVLEERGLMERKGFPGSYDRDAFIRFLSGLKSGLKNLRVPVYSHLIYDIVPGRFITVNQPDIVIVEGLNILQPGPVPEDGAPVSFVSDYLDFAIYLDAAEPDLRHWFLQRFLKLRQTAFVDPQSFFHRFAQMPEKEAIAMAIHVWETINLPNLEQNILPTRGRADLILTKQRDHRISDVALRRL